MLLELPNHGRGFAGPHPWACLRLDRVNAVAAELGAVAPVSFRVNPDVDARTHPYISTGLKENKFGIDIDTAPAVYRRAAAMEKPGMTHQAREGKGPRGSPCPPSVGTRSMHLLHGQLHNSIIGQTLVRYIQGE